MTIGQQIYRLWQIDQQQDTESSELHEERSDLEDRLRVAGIQVVPKDYSGDNQESDDHMFSSDDYALFKIWPSEMATIVAVAVASSIEKTHDDLLAGKTLHYIVERDYFIPGTKQFLEHGLRREGMVDMAVETHTYDSFEDCQRLRGTLDNESTYGAIVIGSLFTPTNDLGEARLRTLRLTCNDVKQYPTIYVTQTMYATVENAKRLREDINSHVMTVPKPMDGVQETDVYNNPFLIGQREAAVPLKENIGQGLYALSHMKYLDHLKFTPREQLNKYYKETILANQ